MTNDQVKYQLERAEDALHKALQYGCGKINPYILSNITNALKEIDSAKFSTTFEKTCAETRCGQL